MAQENTRLGIWLMVATTTIFAIQDSMSRHLAETYNVWLVVMLRYWFFALFVMAMSARQPGGWRAVARTARPLLQMFRGVLLAAEICVMVAAFVLLGLVEAHAVFASNPLIVAALSVVFLGERVGWRRWIAIAMGFVGILIILQPGVGVFNPYILVAFLAAGMFACYALLTRYVAREDSAATSFFWTGVGGAVFMTLAGVWFWQNMTTLDWGLMLLLCICGVAGHWLLIRCYEVAEASAVQPFAYLQLVFASAIGIVVFGDALRANVALGAAIVIAAGIFTLVRSRQVAQK